MTEFYFIVIILFLFDSFVWVKNDSIGLHSYFGANFSIRNNGIYLLNFLPTTQYYKLNKQQFILDKDGTRLPLNQSAINQFFLPTVRINKYSMFSKMDLSEFATHIGHELFILRKNYPEIFNEINFFNFAGHGDVFMDFSDNTQIIAKENNLKLHFKILDEFKTIKLRLDNYSVIDLRVSNQLIVKENSYIKS